MLRLLLTLEAFVDVAFGLALLVAPGILLSIYGMATDRDGTFLARFLGATLLGFGGLCWFARAWPESDHRRLLIRVLFGTSALGLVVCLAYQLQPGVPWQALVFVVLTLAFAIGWGYLALRHQTG